MLLFGNFEHYLFQCIEPNIGHEYRCWFLDISIPHFNNASQVLEIPKGTNTWMKFLLWFFTWISKNHTLSWNSDSWFIKCDWNVKQVGSFGGKDRAKEKKKWQFYQIFYTLCYGQVNERSFHSADYNMAYFMLIFILIKFVHLRQSKLF